MPSRYSSFLQNKDGTNDFLFDYSSPFEYSSALSEETSFNHKKYKSPFTYSSTLSNDHVIEKCQDEGWPLHLLHTIIVSLCYFLVVIIFPISGFFCLKKIHSLERMVIIRLGKLQPVKGPGLVIVLPCIDQCTRVDLKLRTFVVPTQQLLTADSAVVEVGARIGYQVADVVSYVTRVHKLEHTVQQLGLTLLANLVSQKDQDDIETDQRLLQTEMQAEMNRTTLSWGLEIIEIKICPMNVIKPAEPTDAVGTLVSALKSALKIPSETEISVLPSNGMDNTTCSTSSSESVVQNHQTIALTIKHLADTAIKKGLFKGSRPIFKLEVTGPNAQILYCCFNDSAAKVLEGRQDYLQPDVSLQVSEEDLHDFLFNKVSPIHAYMQGHISVTGDWSLLKIFSEVFE